MKSNYFRAVFIVTAFSALIAFPLVNSFFVIVPDIESTENRQSAPMPVFDINRLDPFPALYEKYYNDHFSLRSLMVKCYNLFNLVLFRKSPVPDQVAIGREGWLYLAGNEMDTYCGKNRFSNEELNQFAVELSYRQRYLAQQNCRFYFMIAPSKSIIYPEYIPASIYRQESQSWGEQLIDYLAHNTSVKTVNLYTAFARQKSRNLLYHKLDNHWNQFGAFYAANEFFTALKSDFPETEVFSENDLVVSVRDTNGGNITGMLGGIGLFSDQIFTLTPRNGFRHVPAIKYGYAVPPGFPYSWDYENVLETKLKDRPRILIISDSFGEKIFPFLSENFSRSVKIFDAWEYKLNEEIVDREKPDIVLLMVLESNLRNMLAHQSSQKPR